MPTDLIFRRELARHADRIALAALTASEQTVQMLGGLTLGGVLGGLTVWGLRVVMAAIVGGCR